MRLDGCYVAGIRVAIRRTEGRITAFGDMRRPGCLGVQAVIAVIPSSSRALGVREMLLLCTRKKRKSGKN